MASSAEDVAKEYEKGHRDLTQDIKTGGGGSGKQRSKTEQLEHKKPHPEGDTRKIVENALHGGEKRREEEMKKNNSEK